MATYRTMSGDTWDIIAYNALGSGYRMDRMIAANPQYAEQFAFPAGIELEIPEIEDEISDTNPPWFGGVSEDE